LQEIAVLGVRLSLDDFGTRYSSLSYLKSMPIQMLKIDRSFLLDVERSKRDARIVRAVIDMAHAMDMQVVAEGVESDTQLEVLRELGCDEFQGNWFCPALPASDLTNRILAFAK
jgi:EAL domain-containing protein (putative c-di-GMP-specific phosphodiesterase class I)